MKKVKIYTTEHKGTPTFDYTSDSTKEEIIKELFKKKIYACQFANGFIAINTDKILFVEIEEVG